MNQGNGALEIEVEQDDEVETITRRGREDKFTPPQLGFPMPQMEILVFEGANPRWWIRKCKRLFEWYNVPAERRVALAAAYFDDMVDAWFQG